MARKKQWFGNYQGWESEDYSSFQNTSDVSTCDWNQKPEHDGRKYGFGTSQDYWRTRNSRTLDRNHKFIKSQDDWSVRDSDKPQNDFRKTDYWPLPDWAKTDSCRAPDHWGTKYSGQAPNDWRTGDSEGGRCVLGTNNSKGGQNGYRKNDSNGGQNGWRPNDFRGQNGYRINYSKSGQNGWRTNDFRGGQNSYRINDSKAGQNGWRTNDFRGRQNGCRINDSKAGQKVFRTRNELDSCFPKVDWLSVEEKRSVNEVEYCSKTVIEDIYDSKPVTENPKITVEKNVVDPTIFQDASNDLNSDFQNLLEKGDFTDVVLTCGNDHIKAHKLVLSARSPVFSAMFASPMQESEKSNVIIDDVAPQVIHDLLLFIYSGRIKNLDQQKAFDLLYMAEKYLIKSLKQVCVEFLKSITSEENALQVLQTADLYDDQLKSDTIAFISKHFSTLQLTKDWKTLQSKNSILAVEVLSDVVDLLHAK